MQSVKAGTEGQKMFKPDVWTVYFRFIFVVKVKFQIWNLCSESCDANRKLFIILHCLAVDVLKLTGSELITDHTWSQF